MDGGQQAKILRDLISTNKKLSKAVYLCHSNYTGSLNRRMAVQASPGIKARPYLEK
jgi:hypothetical protein